MNKILKKLREQNKRHYDQFIFCVTLAIVLVTSFSSLLFSETIQETLPLGGDSRSQIEMIFAIDMIACMVFIVYAEGLFLKYKSKEIGILLVCGISKKKLKKTLLHELLLLGLGCSAVGMILGGTISILLWNLFHISFMKQGESPFRLSVAGFLVGGSFCLLAMVCILLKASKYIRKSNLHHLLITLSKSEPLPDTSAGYGIAGGIFTFLGIFLGYIVPIVIAGGFHQILPEFWSGTYLFSVIGIYMLAVYFVGNHKKGKNPEKYYKNVILYSTLKFQGKQTVRNMLVLTLMITAGLFALFYPVTILVSQQEIKKTPIDFSIPYPLSENQITRNDIAKLANEYQEKVVNYQEIVFSRLLCGFIERNADDNGKIYAELIEQDKFCEFINESTYNQVGNQSLKVPEGSYYHIVDSDTRESFWEKYSDLQSVMNSVTGEKKKLHYMGTAENPALYGVGTWNKRYVLNDKDYKKLTQSLTPENQVKQILFHVAERENSFQFSKALYLAILEKASENMAVSEGYDEWQEKKALLRQEEYFEGERLELVPSNSELMYVWKYYPYLSVYMESIFLKNAMVYFLLFFYVAVICLLSAGLSAYTRAITVGINCKSLFLSLKRLGANNQYIQRCIDSQLKKIFVLPMVISSILIYSFKLSMTYFNDRFLSDLEVRELLIDLIMIAAVVIGMNFIYKKAFRVVKKIIVM